MKEVKGNKSKDKKGSVRKGAKKKKVKNRMISLYREEMLKGQQRGGEWKIGM